MVAATRGGGQGRLDLRAGPGCCGALGCDCGGGRKKRVHPTLSAREIDREREARIATLFDAHDISGSGTLKDGELKAFMEETSSTKSRGQPRASRATPARFSRGGEQSATPHPLGVRPHRA